jgi:hypothetical protein
MMLSNGGWKERGTLRYPMAPYGTQYLFLAKNKRKKDEKLCSYIFILSRTIKTQVDHDNKTAVTQRRDAKLAAVSLVRLLGRITRATISHDLQEAILADQGAPADHSKILARSTNLIKSVQLNSVGGAYPPR